MIHSHTLSNNKENYSKKKKKKKKSTKHQRTRRYCNVVLLMNAILKAWEEQDQPEELQWW